MLQHDRHVCTVEVRADVGAHDAHRRDRLQPDVANHASVVPPVGETPWHDVVACPPLGVVDADNDRVVGARDQCFGRVQREWRVAAFVVAEIVAVQPDVGDVADGAELEGRVLTEPHGRDCELAAVEAGIGRLARRHVEGAGNVERRPVGVVICRVGALAQLICDRLQVRFAVGQAQGRVQRLRVKPPGPVEVGGQPWLAVEGGHGLPGLEGHLATGFVLEAQGRLQVRLAARRHEAACRREERQHEASGEDGGLPAVGHRSASKVRGHICSGASTPQ